MRLMNTKSVYMQKSTDCARSRGDIPLQQNKVRSFIHSFIPLACAECDNSLPFSGASSIPICHVLFPATLLYQLFFHLLSPHLVIYFLAYLSILLFPNSYIILFWEFYFLPFSVHVQTNVLYLTLFSIIVGFLKLA
jgi:hypothetical protein